MANRRSPDPPRSAAAAASTPRRAKALPKPSTPAARATVTPEARHRLIAQSAYLRAERRGFAPGRETEDWRAAEAEVDALLKVSHGGSAQ